MKKIKQSQFTILICALIFLSACKKDDPIIPNEEEVITTLKYSLIPTQGGNTVVLEFKDLDGDGGNAPIISNGTLQSNTSYVGTVSILNESETPADNISLEVMEESNDHQMFYSTTNNLLDISTTDVDKNGNPLGLNTTLQTGNIGSETLVITLKHEPKKPNNGSLADAGGETDIEVSFDVTIE